jgi:hypothetical protein
MRAHVQHCAGGATGRMARVGLSLQGRRHTCGWLVPGDWWLVDRLIAEIALATEGVCVCVCVGMGGVRVRWHAVAPH